MDWNEVSRLVNKAYIKYFYIFRMITVKPLQLLLHLSVTFFHLMLDHLMINITNVRVSLNWDPNYLSKCILIYVNCNSIFIQNTNPLARKTLFGWQRIVSVSSSNNEYSDFILHILSASSVWNCSVTLISLRAGGWNSSNTWSVLPPVANGTFSSNNNCQVIRWIGGDSVKDPSKNFWWSEEFPGC